MDDFIADTIAGLGYLGIALLMALENVFPPFPSEAIMGASALAIQQDKLEFWPVFVSGTIGSVAGNYVWYWIGHKLGYERLRPFIDRFGRWLTLDWEDVESLAAFFRQYGQWAVLFVRALPFMRTMISLPAGLTHMSVWRFVIFTTIGVAIWNLMLIFGMQWLSRTFDQTDDLVSWIIIATGALAIGSYLFRLATWTPRARR
ncbi:DedA family protein [Qipengyuania sp. JC766]|uniref:DedA family protein n=1 Tax=Qipengyuania sp. JC766 TaxID=3232139 RepID=UPI00345A5465